MKFPCSKCGLCCKKIGEVVTNLKTLNIEVDFPYSWNENGECKMLKDNLCTVYEQRPLICDVERFSKEYGLNKKQFYKENMKACKDLKK